MKLPELPKWISEKDAAEILGISVSKLQQDRHNTRGLPYYKLSRGAVRYKLGELLTWAESCRIEPGRAA